MRTLLRLALTFLSFCWSVLASSCRNENGQSVSWFVAFRKPGSAPRTYYVFDDTSTTASFRMVNNEYILAHLFDGIDLQSDQVLLWNDEPAKSEDASSSNGDVPNQTAHDKGVLYRNSKDNTGFYLLHSVPQFPATSGTSLNPVTPTASAYGQSFICVSSNSDASFQLVWNHVKSQNSQIYHNSFTYPDPPKPSQDVLDSTLEGFRYVTKTSINLNEPYEQLLAPLLKSSLLVESWGRPYEANNCSATYQVVNNEHIQFGSEIFKSTSDHSKYCLAISQPNLLCVGGMNHMTSQAERGGSWLCFSNQNLYSAIKNSIWVAQPFCTNSTGQLLKSLRMQE